MYCSKCSLRNPIQSLIFWNAIFNNIQILCLGVLWIHLTSCLWQRNPRFPKNSLCNVIWSDFDSFESANWRLKSSTNFQIRWKICFCLWPAQVAYSKASQECSFRCKFELASLKRLVWHTKESSWGTCTCSHVSQRNNRSRSPTKTDVPYTQFLYHEATESTA